VSECTPFIVAGSPRTGSSLVLLSLAAHAQVRVFGELFHPWAEPRPGAGPLEQDRFDARREDALAFLDRAVWSMASNRAPFVGFKLFVSHMRSPGAHDLFRRLSEHVAGLRVLHCHRANSLDVWVSLKQAEATGVWARLPGGSPPAPPSAISAAPDDLVSFFEEMESSDALLRTFHPPELCHVVDYENLSRDYPGTMQSIWSFLGLPAFDLGPPLAKQNTLPHSRYLKNYAELRRHFAGTRFAGFFGSA
jgi:LPS sulfotransferase NodH